MQDRISQRDQPIPGARPRPLAGYGLMLATALDQVRRAASGGEPDPAARAGAAVLRAALLDADQALTVRRGAGSIDPIDVARARCRIRAASIDVGERVEDLLRVSRIAHAPLRPCRLDLSRMAASIVAQLRADEPTHPAVVEITPGLTGRCDGRLAGLVLAILLGNAWASSARQRSARIVFGRTADGAHFVRDDGAGRPPASAGGRTGLLAAELAIKRLGGDIRCVSQPGRGTTVAFRI